MVDHRSRLEVCMSAATVAPNIPVKLDKSILLGWGHEPTGWQVFRLWTLDPFANLGHILSMLGSKTVDVSEQVNRFKYFRRSCPSGPLGSVDGLVRLDRLGSALNL